MKRELSKKGAILLLSFLVSCTSIIEEVVPSCDENILNVTINLSDSDLSAKSRMNIAINNTVKYYWEDTDTIGIFPNDGYQVAFPLKTTGESSSATFTGGGWALKASSIYAAYYPFEYNYRRGDSIPVSYWGQKQIGNNNSTLTDKYNYMFAVGNKPAEGSLNFDMQRIGRFIILNFHLPEPTTLTSVKLTAPEAVFTTKGYYNLWANTHSISPLETSESLTIALEDFITNVANEEVKIYFFIPPVNLSNKKLTLETTDINGRKLLYYIPGKDMTASKAYALTGSMEDNNTNTTTISEAGKLKSLLGQDYLNITSLKVVGPINGDDVLCLRQMSAASGIPYAEQGKLTKLDLSEASVVEGGNFYYENTSSKQYYTSNDVIGDYMFEGCKLQKIVLPNSITTIGESTFFMCKSLTSVKIGDSVTSIGAGAFNDCEALASIEIGKNVKSIGDYAFWSCNALTSIKISDTVTSIGSNAFYACEALASVYITNISSWCNIEFSNATSNPLCYGGKLYLNNKELTELIIPEDITKINNFAFDGCNSLVNITIDNEVTSIGRNAFSNCEALISATIGDNAKSIGNYAFKNCKALTSVSIGKNVTSIGTHAFYNCNALESIIIDKKVASIGKEAFWGCNLTSVHITDIAAWCNIDFFDEYSSPLNNAKLYLNNKELTELIIPEDITRIKEYAFEGCYSIVKLTISNSVTSIGERSFCDCEALTSVTIGDIVTSIATNAFYGCGKLTSIKLGKSIMSIGESAFKDCNAITQCYCYSTKPPTINNSFNSYPTQTILYIPTGCRSIYKSSDWGNYFSSIEEIK